MRLLRLLGVDADVWRRNLAKRRVDVRRTYTIDLSLSANTCEYGRLMSSSIGTEPIDPFQKASLKRIQDALFRKTVSTSGFLCFIRTAAYTVFVQRSLMSVTLFSRLCTKKRDWLFCTVLFFLLQYLAGLFAVQKWRLEILLTIGTKTACVRSSIRLQSLLTNA